MRWAQLRDLPVRRVPGAGTPSVYALTHELDRWLAAFVQDELPLDPASRDPSVPPLVSRSRWHVPAMALGGVAAIAATALIAAPAIWKSDVEAIQTKSALPANPEVMALYLQARDDWAQRNAASLKRAVTGFGTVVSRDPGFAPAYVGLADAYLLVREFDAMPEGQAYPQAKAAAQAALALDPNLADAHRALGFVKYWWEHNPVAAGAAFRKASALAPNDAQTHHWYGNILASNGESRAALRELNTARLLNPGSDAIQADLGAAQWSAGDTAGAVKLLEALSARLPDFVSPHSYLAQIRWANQDYPGFVREYALWAGARADPVMEARASAARQAFASGGSAALCALIVRNAEADLAMPQQDRQWLTMAASNQGDRAKLVAVLREADKQNEKWQFPAFNAAIARRWRDDPVIPELLARRQPPPIE